MLRRTSAANNGFDLIPSGQGHLLKKTNFALHFLCVRSLRRQAQLSKSWETSHSFEQLGGIPYVSV